MNRREIKSKLKQLDISIKEKSKHAVKAQKLLADDTNERERLNKMLDSIGNPVEVSDHALIRYMERHMEFDIEGCKKSLLTPLVVEAINNGAKKVTIEGIRFVVEDKIIVTTY